VVLVLIIYIIGLRLIANTCSFQVSALPDLPFFEILCFPKNYPTLWRFLHTIPLVGTSCVIGRELVLDVHPPTLAAVVLLFSFLPLIIVIVHHGRWWVEPVVTVLPIGVRDPPATMSSSVDMTVMSNSTNSVPAEAGRYDIC